MTEAQKQFADIIGKYEAFLGELAAQEDEKYRALVSYEPARINHVVSSQQAALMRLEQLEQKREQAAQQAGLGGLSLREAAEKIGGQEGEQLLAALRRITRTVEQIRFTNEKSIKFAQANLKAYGSALPQESVGYAPGAKAADKAASSLFETRI